MRWAIFLCTYFDANLTIYVLKCSSLSGHTAVTFGISTIYIIVFSKVFIKSGGV